MKQKFKVPRELAWTWNLASVDVVLGSPCDPLSPCELRNADVGPHPVLHFTG